MMPSLLPFSFSSSRRGKESYSRSRTAFLTRRNGCLALLVALLILILHSLYAWASGYQGLHSLGSRIQRTYEQWRGLRKSSFRFPARPLWLDPVTEGRQPLVLRIAVLSAAPEIDLRTFLRQEVYNTHQISSSEVQFDVRFFVGKQQPGESPSLVGDIVGQVAPWAASGTGQSKALTDVDDRVLSEMRQFGDIELLDVEENAWALGRKRFAALEWAGHKPDFDFFLTADSDAFVRLTALVRRMHFLRPELVAGSRTNCSLWGSLHPSNSQWRKTTLAGTHDERFTGEWQTFPVGMGYLMSQALVAQLNGVSSQLPHDVAYFSDDMLVGSWISQHAPETWFISDMGGFHDPPGHGTKTWPIDWSNVLIHHVDLNEMRYLRAKEEFRGEWTSSCETCSPRKR